MAQEGSLGDAVSAVCDAAGATRFAEGFMARWTRPRTRGDGCRPDETAAAEQRLGFPLPDALTACYRLLGRRDLTSRQDPLLPPDRLWVEDDVLVFRVENQHCALWGVPVPHLGEADPPVVFQNVAHTRPTGWRPFLDRFSSATVEMVLSEALLYGGGTEGDVNDNRELDEKTLRAVEDRFDRIPFPDHPPWANPDGHPVRWFADDGLLLRDDARQWLWVRARSAARLNALRTALPGDWITRQD